MNSISITEQASVKGIVEALKHQDGALLPILHEIQNELGYIPEQAIPQIADALQQTAAEIHGAISFYHQFRNKPAGKHKLQICRAEACQARGARQLEQHIKNSLGIDYHETTQNDGISLNAVYCLGCCSTGPNIRIDNDVVGKVDKDKFDRIITSYTEVTT